MKVEFTDTATKKFLKLDRSVQKRIKKRSRKIEKIDDYSPNDETIQAIKECDTGKGSTRYDSYDDFL